MSVTAQPDLAYDRDRLSAAKLIASDRMPYFSGALFAMVPVPAPGLGTFAVDARWRMYFDPAKLAEWSVAECAAVLLHEVGHLLRDHAPRAVDLHVTPAEHHDWNCSTDGAINADLDEVPGVTLPGRCVYPEDLPGCSRGMSAEEMFVLNRHRTPPPPQGGGPGQGSGVGQGDGQGSGASAGDAPGAGPGQPGSGPAAGNGCGSGADAHTRPWDLGEDGTAGLTPDEADHVRQQTAVAIREHSRARGSVPSGLGRWAEERLEPVVDWRRALNRTVRQALGQHAGRRDYSYRRPSRRSGGLSLPGEAILPSMVAPPPPVVAVVVDTSGSVSDVMLGAALAEIRGILRSSSRGRRDIAVLSCDASVHAVQRVTRSGDVRLAGGGGTNMIVGLVAASQLKPKPDVVILLTDGETPYPSLPPDPHIRYIVGILLERPARGDWLSSAGLSVPDWATALPIPAT